METPGPPGTNHSHVTSAGGFHENNSITMACDINIGFGKVKLWIRREGLSMSKQRGMRGIPRERLRGREKEKKKQKKKKTGKERN